jgi:hypothetical protein
LRPVPIEEHLLQGGFKELELRAADPNAKLPIMDYIAHFSNRTRDQVIAFFEAEAGITRQTPAPAAPAAVAAAFLLCLFLVPSAEARSPIRTPDRWYPERQEVQIDPAVFSSPVSIDQRGQILWPDSAYVRHGEPIYPDSYRPIYYQTAYQSNTVGFWQAGPAPSICFRSLPLAAVAAVVRTEVLMRWFFAAGFALGFVRAALRYLPIFLIAWF